MWIAIGLGMWVCRRRAAGAAGRDPRTVLVRALALIAVIAAVALALYAVVAGAGAARSPSAPEYESGAGCCSCSARPTRCWPVTYLAVQFLLALRRRAFAVASAVAAMR